MPLIGQGQILHCSHWTRLFSTPEATTWSFMLADAPALGTYAAVVAFLVLLQMSALWAHSYFRVRQAYVHVASLYIIWGVRALKQTRKWMLLLRSPKALQALVTGSYGFCDITCFPTFSSESVLCCLAWDASLKFMCWNLYENTFCMLWTLELTRL